MRDCHLKHIVIGMWPRVAYASAYSPRFQIYMYVCMKYDNKIGRAQYP